MNTMSSTYKINHKSVLKAPTHEIWTFVFMC
uniref:Uncharacterized protein n=1 Tax=Anguilla anguilla TaxID=7936 RepID=A0A0E9XWI3_ANGAN